MSENRFEINYAGKRDLTPGRKRTFFFQGMTQFFIGILGCYLLFGKDEHTTLMILFATNAVLGIYWIVYARLGKSMITERTYFCMDLEAICFKNPFQKKRKISRAQLYDVVMNSYKVEFILEDQSRSVYDFSLLPEKKTLELKAELERLHNDLWQTNFTC